MKLFAMALCIACVPMFGQDNSSSLFEQRILAALQQVTDQNVERAIILHRPFWLTDRNLGPIVITATASKVDGKALMLTGVEIKTNSVALTADEAVYDWVTRQIEPHGNVHLAPLPHF